MPKFPWVKVYVSVMVIVGTLPCVSITSLHQDAHIVRGALLTKGSDSSFAEAHRDFNSEPTHKEDEVEDQEDEVEDGRDK